MFKVQIRSGKVCHDFAFDFTEQEAIDFCESYGWEYMDENCFVWDMDYEEQ